MDRNRKIKKGLMLPHHLQVLASRKRDLCTSINVYNFEFPLNFREKNFKFTLNQF